MNQKAVIAIFGTTAVLLGVGELRADTVSYNYDALHRLTAVTYPDGSQIQYSYDPSGNMTQKVVTAGGPDTDGDGMSDNIDPDDDNDGYDDVVDVFPLDPTEWANIDGDGTGNNADIDDDGDGFDDVSDNCPKLFNTDQSDTDGDGIGDACDGPDDGCNSGPLLIEAETFAPGAQAFASAHSITVQGVVHLQPGAELSLQAPQLAFGPGLRVAAGATLRAQAGAVNCSTLASVPIVAEASPLPKAATALAPAAPVSLASAEQLTEEAQALLALYGVDRDAMAHLLADPEGWWLLFETAQDILPADGNGTRDVYRLDTFTETLALLSRTPQGSAGNGPSGYPAADASGELVVFQSDAADLAAGDENGVSDIFLHDVPVAETSRITLLNAGAAAHPALDAAGEAVLYDQRGEDGRRQVQLAGLWDGLLAEGVSLVEDGAGVLLDNHHPAISADGRYVAYLEAATEAPEPICRVHVLDRDTAQYARTPCPEPLAAEPEAARPSFSADGSQVQWLLPGADAPLVLPNPLQGAPGENHP